MKKLILILLAIFSVSTVLLATADGPDYWKVYNVALNDVLNLREKPDWKSKKIGEIPFNGKCLQNLGCVGGLTFQEFTELSKAEQREILKKRPKWCNVKFNNMIGWVSGKYLKEDQDSNCYE